MMNKPKKKKLDNRFKWTWQYSLNKKYNQCYDEFEKFLPSEAEIMDIVRRAPRQENGRFSTVEVAKAISKRLGGDYIGKTR